MSDSSSVHRLADQVITSLRSMNHSQQHTPPQQRSPVPWLAVLAVVGPLVGWSFSLVWQGGATTNMLIEIGDGQKELKASVIGL